MTPRFSGVTDNNVQLLTREDADAWLDTAPGAPTHVISVVTGIQTGRAVVVQAPTDDQCEALYMAVHVSHLRHMPAAVVRMWERGQQVRAARLAGPVVKESLTVDKECK